MPIYEYACPDCGHQFEKLMRMDAAPPACPSCGAAEVKKKVSEAGFILKGSGWYADHYGLKKSADGTGSKAAGEKLSDKAAEKPASTSEKAAPAAASAPAPTAKAE